MGGPWLERFEQEGVSLLHTGSATKHRESAAT